MPIPEFETFRSLNSETDLFVERKIDIHIYERSVMDFTENEILFGISEYGDEVVAKFSKQPWKPEREWKGLQAVNANGILTSTPIALVQNLRGEKGILMERIHGVSLSQRPEMIDQFGEIIRRMHEVIKVSGEEWSKSGKFDFSYYEFLIDLWSEEKFFGVKEAAEAGDLIKDFAKMIGSNFKYLKPVFNHGDLHNDQVIIDNEEKLRVIDFELWQESHPLDDVSMYLLHSLRTKRPEDFLEFAKGYTRSNGLSDQERMVLSFYLIFSGLRAVDYFYRFRPNNINNALEQLSIFVQYTKNEHLWKDI